MREFWDKEAVSGKKEQVRGTYLSDLFLRAVDKGLSYLPENKQAINLLKTDLWNEGADFGKNVLGHYVDYGINLYGVDLSWEVVRSVKVNSVLRAQASIMAMPFRNNVFDAILDLSTIDHVPYDKAESVLREYKRLLKPEGILIMAFDAWGLIWRIYFWYLKKIKKLDIGVFPGTDIINQYIYKPRYMLEKMASLGFEVIEEYSIDWFGWSWNRLTAPFWKKLSKTGYDKLVDMEYSYCSKYMKALAKQYVIIAKNNQSKNKLSFDSSRNLSEERLINAWKKHHAANIFLKRQKDKLGLDIVGVTGLPIVYNKFLHHFNLLSVKNLLRKIGGLTDKRALDVGCGTGRWSKYLCDRGAKVTGIDISSDLLRNNNELIPGVHFLNMSACRMIFKDRTFDLVISVTVLQHMPYQVQEAAIKEICRVLKAGGYVLIIEGTREDENEIYKHSFPHSTRSWIQHFEKQDCMLVCYEKNTNPILLNAYFRLRDKIVNAVRQKIDLTRNNPADPLDTSGYDKVMQDKIIGEKHKKYLFLRRVYRGINYCIIYFLTILSYVIEYLNMFCFKYYPTSNGAFLFKKINSPRIQ